MVITIKTPLSPLCWSILCASLFFYPKRKKKKEGKMSSSSLCANSAFSQSSSNVSSFQSKNRLLHSIYSNNFITPSIKKHYTTVIRCSISHRRPEYIPSKISDPKYVRIFDTTLRDGEQSPGATMTTREKLEVARQLAKLGVDIIEAGFPASSESDFEAVRLIAEEIGNYSDENGHVPVICGLSRCNKRDIDKAWEAVKYAKKARVHTFIATSEIHMKYKLKMSREEVVEKATSMVAYARSLGCDDVEFSPEDAGRCVTFSILIVSFIILPPFICLKQIILTF